MAEPSEAAAAVTTGIVIDAAKGMPEVVSDDIAEYAAKAAAPSSEEEAVAEAPQETAAEQIIDEAREDPKFVLEPEVPAELAEELDTPDFEEEAALEVFNEEPEGKFQEQEWETEEEDPRVLEERRLRIAAEKKAQHFEDLRVKAERKKWTEEAKKHFPLSAHALDDLTATSRRGFLRQARAAHQAVLPYVKEALLAYEASLEAERTQVKAEARAEATEAWGTPTSAVPGAPPGDAEALQEEYEDAKSKGQLDRMIGVMRKRAMGEVK